MQVKQVKIYWKNNSIIIQALSTKFTKSLAHPGEGTIRPCPSPVIAYAVGHHAVVNMAILLWPYCSEALSQVRQAPEAGQHINVIKIFKEQY